MILSLTTRTFIKVCVIIIFSIFIYTKITNRQKFGMIHNLVFAICGVILSLAYAFGVRYVSKFVAFIIVDFVNGLILFLVSKDKKPYFIIAYELSVIIAYVIYVISLVITGILLAIIIPEADYADFICVLAILIIYFLIYTCIMHSKRVKNGFNFIKNITSNMVYWLLLVFGIVVILFEFIPKEIPYKSQESIFIGTIFIAISLFMIIKNQITKHYRNNMRDRTIIVQKEEIDAAEEMINELKSQNLKLATTIHKYNHRLSSLENSIRKVMDNSNVEFSNELSIVLEQTKKIEKQFASETKVDVKLQPTNVVSVDNMLEYMKSEAIKYGIDFTLKVNDSIRPLIDKYITEDQFETLLGDHIKDAIIAINSKGEGYKSILVLIGVVDGAYELSIYDTGIEFEIPTLLKIGEEPITTHENEGGSGLGFMTTFETLKSSKASLVIEEYDTSVTNYTKSITIRFDGKCEYRIYSYRSDSIKPKCTGRKIIVKSI